MTKKAIVTLAIGAAYSDRFEQLCRKNWTAYAQRHGFDLVVIKEPLDVGERARRRSPAWQKCLVLGAFGLADYERVVWVDSDILINPAAPSILDGVPGERIGAIDENHFPTPAARQAMLRQIVASAPDAGTHGKSFWESWLDPGKWHALIGLPAGQTHIVQTGVMVLSPKHHRALLEHVYHSYDDGGVNLNYEMRPLSHEIQAHGLQHWIDQRFNALVWWLALRHTSAMSRAPTETELRDFLRDCYQRSYFLHFAGAAHMMPMLDSAGA